MSKAATGVGLGAWLAAAGALAQTAPAPQPASRAPAPPPNATVVVTAQRPPVVVAIDRTIYNVGDDPQTQTSTLADVLRTLPSVDVDLDGNPSLRGDSGVQILVNGQPSALLNGPNRGAALQSLNADQIDHVEVIPDPSAMFKPDGSAGIINIVTKSTFKPGPTGMVRANAGTEGRYNLGANGSWADEDTDIHAGYNFRHDGRKRRSDSVRDNDDPAAGEVSDTDQQVVSQLQRDSQGAWLGADHDASKADHLNLELSWDQRTASSWSWEQDLSDDPASQDVRLGSSPERGSDEEVDGKYVHDFAGEEHKLTLTVKLSRNDDQSDDAYQYDYVEPVQAPSAGGESYKSREEQALLTAEYIGPLAWGDKVQAGASLQRDDNLYDHGQSGVDPITGLPAPIMANQFRFGQWIDSLYGTYQHAFGKLSAQAGLRLEQTSIAIDDETGQPATQIGYFRAYPSLHLIYPLSKTSSLKASYTLRVNRPEPNDLDPYVVVEDAFDEISGNPHLVPQETDGFEIGWQDTGAAGAKAVNVFVRQSYDAITDVSEQVTPTVLLATKANTAGLRSAGLEATASGKASPALSYNFSANVSDNQVVAATGWYQGLRAQPALNAKLSLNWRATGVDLVQLTANYASVRLTSQGYREAGAAADLGYRRELTSRLNAVLTIADVFDSRGQKTWVNTPLAHDFYETSMLGRTVFVGFSYRLGGADGRRPDDRFNFGGGPNS